MSSASELGVMLLPCVVMVTMMRVTTVVFSPVIPSVLVPASVPDPEYPFSAAAAALLP